jgi:glycosyltransferase involved in cell wall biosynthesis
MRVLICPDIPGWIVERCCDNLVANLPQIAFTKRFYVGAETAELEVLAREHDLVYYANWGDCERHIPALAASGTPVLMSVRSHRYPAIVKQMAKQVAAVHVVNEALARDFPGSFYIPDGVGDQFFCKPRVGFVGMPDAYKGYGLVAEACRILDCPFIPATGQIPPGQMPEYYRSVDVVVCASVAEGFSTVMMEALAMGKLVVSTADGEPFHALGRGWDCPRGFAWRATRSAQGIAQAIDRLWQRSMERYRWSNLAPEYEALFVKVAAMKAVAAR